MSIDDDTMNSGMNDKTIRRFPKEPSKPVRKNSGQIAFSTILSIDDRFLNSATSLSSSSSAASLPRMMGNRRHRANTTNSIFTLHSTMESTKPGVAITCVAHVILMYLERARGFIRRNPRWRPKNRWLVFNDSLTVFQSGGHATEKNGGLSVFRDENDNGSSTNGKVDRGVSFDFDFEQLPTLGDIVTFLSSAYNTAQLEFDSLICALILLERLLEKCGRHVSMVLTARNWRTILFTCLVLASKLCDDFTMWSSDFCQIFGVTIKRMNELEMRLLEALQYNVTVKSSEFAQFHFTLRSLAYRLELEGNDIELAFPKRSVNPSNPSHPITADAANKLSEIASRLKARQRNWISRAMSSSGNHDELRGAITAQASSVRNVDHTGEDVGPGDYQESLAPRGTYSSPAPSRQSEYTLYANSGASTRDASSAMPARRIAMPNRRRSSSAFLVHGGETVSNKDKAQPTYLSVDELMIG